MWDLVVGSALLLWSHLVFLILVITSMWLHYEFKLRLEAPKLGTAAAALAAPLSPTAAALAVLISPTGAA